MLNIIIVGAGAVGFSLAQYFAELNYHVTVIEKDEAVCEQIKRKLDIFVVNDKGSSPAALETAGISSADMLIAVTSNDETNLLACNFAMQNNVEKRIARIKSDKYAASSCVDLEKLGVTNFIETEREVVKKILQYVELPGVIESANFQSDNIYLRGYRVTEGMPIANKTLIEVKKMSEVAPLLIVAIIRGGKSLPPIGSQKLLPGDEVVVIMPKNSFNEFRSLINMKAKKLKKIVVSGESLTAMHLADALKPFGEKVVLIDPDPQHGREAASELDGIEVYCGDSTNSDILQELQVDQADCFIAAGKDSEDNIMSCLLAKNLGVAMVIALRDDERYSDLFNSLGIDHVINPQHVTSNRIIEKIRMAPIGTYLKLKTADIEIIRFTAVKKSPVVGKSLRQLGKNLKKSAIVGAIVRKNEVIIPWGDVVIEDDDEVIVLCRPDDRDRLRKLFGGKVGVGLKAAT